ncbi:MAG: MBL fold metallo-hydrolase [Xanthobacteraceae bacterium]
MKGLALEVIVVRLPAWLLGAMLLCGVAVAQGPQQQGRQDTGNPGLAHTRLVVLGAGAGRTAMRGGGEGGMSAAVQVGRDVYLVDFGAGWLDAFYQAGLATPGPTDIPGGLETLRAGFITHLHADHMADYGRLVQFGPTDGLQKRKTPVAVYGPGRVTDSGLFPGIKDRKTLMQPDNPAPGIVDVTESLLQANAADINDNMSDGGRPSPRVYLAAHDIIIPENAGASLSKPSPRMAPFEIYKDENVRVLATLVNHAPIYPAFAFRFETPNGIIVFSGDTNRNDNLINMARGADVLVHEAMDMNWPRKFLPEPRSSSDEAKLRHLLEAHTDVAELGSIASEAGVKVLVLSHLGPPTTSDADYLAQIKGFAGKVFVGRRLFSLGLPIR